MGPFWEYCRGVFIRPRRTFASLMGDSRRLRHGSIALLITALLYSLTMLLLTLVGGEPAIPPLLAIPTKDYYSVQVLFMTPVMILAWLLAAGVVQLLSRPFGGNGTFEDTLSVLGFGIAAPTYATLVPDTVSGILSLIGVITQKQWNEATTQPGLWQALAWAWLTVYVVGFLVLFPLAVAAAQRLRWRQATFVGVVGFMVYQSMLLVFVR